MKGIIVRLFFIIILSTLSLAILRAQSNSSGDSTAVESAPGFGEEETDLGFVPGTNLVLTPKLRQRMRLLEASGISREDIASYLKDNASSSYLLGNQLEVQNGSADSDQSIQIPDNQIDEILPLPNLPARDVTGASEVDDESSDYFKYLENRRIRAIEEQDLKRKLKEEERERELKRKDSILTLRNFVFGQHIFSRKYRYFNTNLGLTPPDEYIVGPGDKFRIFIYGRNEKEEVLEVESDGSVMRQYLGKISLRDLSFKEARAVLINRYRSIAESSSIEVNLIAGMNGQRLRIDLVGFIQQPGPYSIIPGTSILGAIFEAGGITGKGSVRNIQLRSDDKLVKNIDLYDYLLEGSELPIPQQYDYVIVKRQGKIIQIRGDVARPMFYELNEDENLMDLIDFAGGLNFKARTGLAQLIRFEEGKRRITDFNLETLLRNKQDLPLQDGDQIVIQSQGEGLLNYVNVRGSVEFPGVYELNQGDRVTNVIAQAGGLDTTAFMKRAYITRVESPGQLRYIPIDLQKAMANDAEHNLVLQYFDELEIFSETDFNDVQRITITGMVNKPDTFDLTPEMSLRDILYKAGGFRKDADLSNIELARFAEADDLDSRKFGAFKSRQDSLGSDSSLFQIITHVAISDNWQDDPALDSILLAPYQRVKVYSKYDFIYPQSIQLVGAVEIPGKYQVTRTTTLKDILYDAGGLTENADLNEVELYRRIRVRDKGKFGTQSENPEIVRFQLDDDWQVSTVADSILLTDYYRVVIRSESEFFKSGHISVKGRVGKPSTFDYSPKMTLMDAFYKAGGIDLSADHNNIEISRVVEVINENGEIIPTPVSTKYVSTKQDWQADSSLKDILLNPYDQIFVRPNPDFILQEQIFVNGEVLSPGEYAKNSRNERLTSLVKRAGGITDIAYLKGAYLMRDRVGKVSIKLEKALRRPNSKFNISLLEGDRLIIPPATNVVQINGNVLQPGTTVLFEPRKTSFKYYLNQAGGYDRRSQKRLSTVTYADGVTRRVKTFLIFKKYPKMEQGTYIYVPAKEPKGEGRGEGEPKFRINLQEIIASATGILTLILLIDRTFD